MTETFQQYLAKRRITNTAAGEFTREAQCDPAMALVESWPQLRAYLYRRANSSRVKEMLDAAEPVWKGYRASVLKGRRTNE